MRGLIEKLGLLVPLAIVVTFSSWRYLTAMDKYAGLLLFLAGLAFGLVSASKTATLFPIVAATAGFLLAGRKVVCAVVALIVILLYPTLANLVDAQRTHWQYHPVKNSVEQRLQILTDALTGEAAATPRVRVKEEGNSLIRFSHAPYQAYLINEWNEGRPGNSLEDSWTALIPRVLWPEKPIITRFGAELYARIFGVPDATSNQAPTYTGEAFWNYGWIGVIIVSILLGLQLGWFSRKWLELSFGQSTNLGILVLSLPVILTAWAVETWISASYIGGAITLIVLIKAADFGVPFLIAAPRRKTAAFS